jgi:cytidylate kinase
MRNLIVAIDGPSGAGKGTVARAVASALGYPHIDTGAMYRALAWKTIAAGVDLSDESAVAGLGEAAEFDLDDGRVVIDGHDVAAAIRTPDIDVAAARVARYPAVRRALVAKQRAYGERDGGIVMEGRDIGTVVFPSADVKIYLDASPDERARRRAQDPAHAGRGGAVAEVATALAQRDHQDRTRETSPLARAADALYIDTTDVTIEDVVERVLAAVRKAATG